MKQNKKCLFSARQNRTKDKIRKNMFLLCCFLGLFWEMITYYNYEKTSVNFPDIAVTIVCYCMCSQLQQVYQDKPQQKDHLVKLATILEVEALMMAHALQTTYLFY